MVAKMEPDRRVSEAIVGQLSRQMPKICRVRLQKFLSCRNIIEQILYKNFSSTGTGYFSDFDELTSLNLYFGSRFLRTGLGTGAGPEPETRDRRDRGKRLSSKTQCPNSR